MRCSSIILALAAIGPSIAAGPLARPRATLARNIGERRATGPAPTSTAPTSTASATCTSYTPVPTPKGFSCDVQGTLANPDLIRTIRPQQAQGDPGEYCVSQCKTDHTCKSLSLDNKGLCKLYGKVIAAQGFAASKESGVYYYSRRCFKCQKSITTTPYFQIVGANSGTSADGAILQSVEEPYYYAGFNFNESFAGDGYYNMVYYLNQTTGQVLNADGEAGLCIVNEGSPPFFLEECDNPNTISYESPLYCAIDATTNAIGNCTVSTGQNVSSFAIYPDGSAEYLCAGPVDGQSGFLPIDLVAVATTIPPPTTTTTSTSTSSPTGPSPFQLQASNSGTSADGEVLQSVEGDAQATGFNLTSYFHRAAEGNMTYTLDPSTGYATNVDGAANLGIYDYEGAQEIYSVVECAIPNPDPNCFPLSCQIDPTTQAFAGCTSAGGEDISDFYIAGHDQSSGYVLYAGPSDFDGGFSPVDLTAITPF